MKEIEGQLFLDAVYIPPRLFYKKTKNDKNNQFWKFVIFEKASFWAEFSSKSQFLMSNIFVIYGSFVKKMFFSWKESVLLIEKKFLWLCFKKIEKIFRLILPLISSVILVVI